MSGTLVVVRPARPADLPARVGVLRVALEESFWDAFLYFFFQELTLQGVVLVGAVLFIFGGCGAGALALVPLGAAALVAAAVWLHAAQLAAQLPAKLRGEEWGFVAEACGGLGPAAGAVGGGAVRIVSQREGESVQEPRYTQIVGTVSVCRAHSGVDWWLHSLGVRAGWRQRGIGGALLGAARGEGAGKGELHAVVSHLQPAGRALLHTHGWECRGTYHRPLLGDALLLPMAHLALPLPYA